MSLNGGYQYEWTTANRTFPIASICFDPTRDTFWMKDMITAILLIASMVMMIGAISIPTITSKRIPLDAITMLIVD